MSSTLPAPEPSRFALVIHGLCETVARFGARHRAMAPLMLLLWSYLRRTVRRLHSLDARFKAGRLSPSRPHQLGPHAAPPRPRLPRAGSWLGRLGWEFRGHASQLQALLDSDPDLRALLAAAPERVGRLLRPLCRMLGVRLAPPPRQPSGPPPAQPAAPDPPGTGVIQYWLFPTTA